jgi:hypothetical protein
MLFNGYKRMEGDLSVQETKINIEEICKKIFKETVLDVFFLIMRGSDISKTEIARMINGEENKTQKSRFAINEAIAKLEGALLIDSWTESSKGAPQRYYLTAYGEVARGILEQMCNDDPRIIKGTKIVAKEFEGSDINGY